MKGVLAAARHIVLLSCIPATQSRRRAAGSSHPAPDRRNHTGCPTAITCTSAPDTVCSHAWGLCEAVGTCEARTRGVARGRAGPHLARGDARFRIPGSKHPLALPGRPWGAGWDWRKFQHKCSGGPFAVPLAQEGSADRGFTLQPASRV